MIWTRKQLKEQAAEALQRNYWKIVLVSFLALLFCNGLLGAGNRARSDNEETHSKTAAQTQELPGDTENSSALKADSPAATKAMAVGISVFVVISLLLFVFLYVLHALLIFPFQVGVSRFMLKSIDDTGEVREIAYGFDHSYKNVIKTMFHYDIRIFFWTLLFIIPGIYKQYQYRMVPYILAEHPDIDHKKALRESAEMMQGNKWKALVLDLSFLLLHIGGLMTCGILEIFYVIPYQNLTNAALYRTLSKAGAPETDSTCEVEHGL